MCGRYQAWVDDDELVRIIEREKRGNAMRYFQQNEVFPGSILPVLYGSYANVRAHLSIWGFPEHISAEKAGSSSETENNIQHKNTPVKNSGRLLINARAETAASKVLFKNAVMNNSPTERRIIVLTSGYYEWKTDASNKKIRFHIRPHREHAPLLLAGLETTVGKDKYHHVILTTSACGSPAEIHDRMPLILSRDQIRPWLYDTDFALAKLQEKIPYDLFLRQAE